jgi:FdhD protein
MAFPVTHKKIHKIIDHQVQELDDLIAVEEPMELKLNFLQHGIPTEKSISVTMRTPGHDFELAAGFLFTEGILVQTDAIAHISYCKKAIPQHGENVVKVMLKHDFEPQLDSAERNFYISGSCGICGKASIDAIAQSTCFAPNFEFEIPQALIFGLMIQMQQVQVNFKYTGGIHACAMYDAQGALLQMREDVGRHNALDKLIGYFLLQQQLPLNKNILLLSGRISFELIQKAAMAGIPIVCGVGAPSSLAIETAEKLGITLIGFLKEKSMNIYAHANRIIL